MSLSPKQQQLIRDLGNPLIEEHAEDGGSRAGKTWGILSGIIGRAIKYPGSRHLIARYRLNHLISTAWIQTLYPLLKETFPNGGWHEDKQLRIITLPNGSTIWGAGLDDKDRVEKIMGSEYATVFINEATQITYQTYQKLLSRLSQTVFSKDGKECPRKMILDCNPRNRLHWIYRYFITGQDPESGEALPHEQTIRMRRRNWIPPDNPYLSKQYIDALSRRTGPERQRLFEGKWVDTAGLVYPLWEDAIVDPFDIPDDWQVVSGVDFGHTNPFVCLWFAYDQSNEIWYLFDEYYEVRKTVKVHCAELKNRRRAEWIVADHNAENRATMAENGFPTRAAKKDVPVGIQTVTDILEAKDGTRLRIFRSCVHVIEEISTYSWAEPQASKNAKEEPIKSMDHAMDALRYFAMEVANPAIARIRWL